MITLAPVAQLDRVSDSDSEGHRFDSCRVYHTPAVFTAGAFFPSAGVLPDANAACRPAGLRLRKRCRHFAVPSPLGLLTTPAGCTKPLRRFSPQGFLFSEQESYRMLTRLPHKKFCVFFAGTPGNIACELYIAAAKSGVRKRCRHFAVPSPPWAPYASCRVYHTPAVFTAGAFFPSAGVLPMPKRNNTNQPVSDSLRRFSADTTCQYVYYCLRRLREKSSSNSSLTGGTVPRRRFLLRQGNRRG